jgi:exodeoxyribonuclease V alpha subunit
VTLAAHLLRAIPTGAHLLLVGDVDQLPSVGPGRVLADLIEGGMPAVRLSTIYRQAEQSLIVRAAHAIRQGEPPALENRLDDDDCFFFELRDSAAVAGEVVDLVTRRIPGRFSIHPDAIRVLAPQYGGPAGIDALNAALQAVLNPPDPRRRECPWRDGALREGDRLVWTRNLPRHDLINGEEVWVRAIAAGDGATRVTIATEDGRTLTLPLHELEALPAYCLSVHKAQGSEYAAAVVVCAAGYAKMLNRPLVYTALTRAKRLGVLIGTRAALHAAVARADESARRTTLAERVGRRSGVGR